MNAVRAAFAVEARKAVSSRVIRTTSVLVALGIGLLAGALVAAARAGNQQVLDQLGQFGDDHGWQLLAGVVAQITAAGALLAFGVALSWNLGREFTEGTIGGLFAQPVHRSMIVLAKMIIHLGWVVLLAAVLALLTGVAGIVIGLGPPDVEMLRHIGRQFLLTVLTGLLSVPVAWVTTWARSMLAGIGATIAIIVVAQVSVVIGAAQAAWIPMAAPALWILQLVPVSGWQLAVVGLTAVGFGGLTVMSWWRLQLDR